MLLQELATSISEPDLSEDQARNLSSLIQNCHDILEKSRALVQKNEILDHDAPSFGAKVRKGSKKIRWNQDDVRDIRAQMISTTTTLNAFMSNLAR